MISIEGPDVNNVFYQLCKLAPNWPEEVRRGGNKMWDSPHPVAVTILDPRKRVINMRHRNNSIVAACAETLWVLTGYDDVGWLSKYLPRAAEFSDCGKHWRAGYGPRLRGESQHSCCNESFQNMPARRTDQIDQVINHLKAEPNSRRAVITLFEPTYDDYKAKDYPCTQSLSFMIRRGRLDLSVFIRSNDLVWGWSGVNVFEFTVMQEIIADLLGVPLGSYHMISVNLHVYDRHFNMVKKIASAEKQIADAYRHWSAPRHKSVIPSSLIDSAEPAALLTGRLHDFFRLEHAVSDRQCVLSTEAEDYPFMNIGGPSVLDDIGCIVLAACARTNATAELENYFLRRVADEALQNSYWKMMKGDK